MQLEKKQRRGVTFLAADGLGAPHGFSTRLGGVSRGIFAGLNIGLHRGDEEGAVAENYRRLCAAVGARSERLVLANQVHGTNILEVTEKDVKAGLFDPVSYQADGLTTNCPGVGLVVFSADCVPLLLHDPVTGAVAALHAGWRGTAAGMAARGVQALVDRYGARPQDIRAAVGPAIGPCCYQCGLEVKEALEAGLGGLTAGFVTSDGPEKCRVDLKHINAAALTAQGILPEHLAVAEDCTCCRPDLYWSHRYTHGERGSQGALIVGKGGEAG